VDAGGAGGAEEPRLVGLTGFLRTLALPRRARLRAAPGAAGPARRLGAGGAGHPPASPSTRDFRRWRRPFYLVYVETTVPGTAEVAEALSEGSGQTACPGEGGGMGGCGSRQAPAVDPPPRQRHKASATRQVPTPARPCCPRSSSSRASPPAAPPVSTQRLRPWCRLALCAAI